MNKKKSKALAFLLATALIVPTTNGSIYAATDLKTKVSVQQTQEKEENTQQVESQCVAMIEKQEYKTLQEAFNAVPTDGKQVRIVMQNNITDMKTADIATLEKGKNVVLDMNGKSITVASDFKGRPIVNNGTMIVTGNGVINSENAQSGGLGAIDNFGTLTIEDGHFTGYVLAGGSVIRNKNTGDLTINGGTFDGSTCIIRNVGKARIYGGKFKGKSCSSCDKTYWSYSIVNAKEGDVEPELYIYGNDVEVEGVQGAVSVSAGYGEIHGGNFKTVPCEKHPNSAFYALYVAGESGEVQCNVYDGIFKAATRPAAYIGNSNDGGLKKDAITKFYGGDFTSGGTTVESIFVDSKIVEGNKSIGTIEIYGGEFKKSDGSASTGINGVKGSDLNSYVAKDENGVALFKVENGMISKTDNNPTKDYTAKEVAEVKPTCTSEGHIKYYTCEEIPGKYFKDANLSEEISIASTVLPKLPHVFGEWTVKGEIKTRKCTTCDLTETMSAGVASVDGKAYETLDEAIKAAMSGEDKTVKLLSDIKVATWNQIWNIKGITLDGNGKTITVDKIESLENHDAVLHSAGGNTFKNLTIDLRSVKPGKAQGIRAISASDNDTIDNVTIIGGENASYGITAGSSCKNLTVKNSNISNCGHGVYLEGANDATVVINNNTFDGCEYASILYSKNSTFKENIVKGGKVNIMHKESVVRENTFEAKDKTKSRIKFYKDGIKFEYNKIMNNSNGEAGAIVVFATASDTKVDPINPRSIVLDNNYWGSDKPKLEEIIKLSKDNGVGEGDTLEALIKDVIGKVERNRFDTPKELEDALNPNTGGGIVIPSTPSKPSKPTYKHEEIVGSDRYDTAAKIADKLGSYDNVVLVNATSTMSDGLSASGLAGKEKGAILLTKKDSIPKATMDRIKKVKKVYIIGGEAAISQKVYNEITKNVPNIKIERFGGKTRVETSELVAKKLGNYSDAFVVNGFKGEADAMSASAIAAKKGAPILLTNGKKSTHVKRSGVEYYVIGGSNVVDKSIADKYNAEVLAGKDRYETNREVITEFYSNSDKLYLANGDTLVDALTASPLAKNEGIVLVNEKSDNSILKDKHTVQVGGMNFEIEFEK